MSAEFIKMISELHEERFNIHLADIAQNRTPCALFSGFDFNQENMVANINVLIKTGLNVTCAIVIADMQANTLKDFVDVPIITLENFPNFGAKNFPVTKPQEVFIMASLKDFVFMPFFTRHEIEMRKISTPERFLLTMKHLPEIYSVYEMLGSVESKKVFCAAIKGNVTGRISDYRFAPEPQYFLKGFMPSAGDIAIDGGAYDCATSIDFAKCGAKVYAFEMNAINYKYALARLEKFGEGYDITLENLGLSGMEREENYFNLDVGSRINPNGNLTAKFIDLDTYVERNNLPRVDYIKLDIEGAELEMLQGAAKTIARCKPKMAVSAYHKLEDLWTLATYIKSIRPDYKFEFRHYRIDCKDYMLSDDEREILKYFGLNYFAPTYCEMVLYCN